ncbi:hypothetical protein RE432_10415 [Pusillimonas sp. SM2304]|uniref:hypothetical protein n=1 Tax=Pusillimonas sp. SM2304 TaxID=3073241 RepID=UPI00287543EC|nr:hypothetical protein [Pusillimonas sp. SM2304]MDS1140848.1 hypothetical protein [Pusillimonas sp. SM2304]
MNGDPSAGSNIIPLRDYWVAKNEMTDRREEQWISCGGNKIGGYALTEEDIRHFGPQRAGKVKFDELQYCMMKNGYRYTDTCVGEIPSQYPACQSLKPNR